MGDIAEAEELVNPALILSKEHKAINYITKDVVVALKAGGAGTLFWMWISAFLGMAIKYTEIILAMLYRDKNPDGSFCGGPMYYLQRGIGSRLLALAFTISCLFVSFCMGNSVQSNTIATILSSHFNVSTFHSGVFLMLLTAFVVLGGTKRIASFSSKLVPVMSLLYIGSCIVILMMKVEILPSAFHLIFQEAFSFSSFAFGTSSYCLLIAMKNGFSKGVFSNEAGLGSAPIAHATTHSSNVIEQGVWGIFEVFFTTIVICTLTGLVVLCSDSFLLNELDAINLIKRSFDEVLPQYGSTIVSISTVLFSLSSIFGWAFYGECCLRFLFIKYKTVCVLYRVAYVIVVLLGAVIHMDLIWSFSEIMNGLMAIPNLIGIVLLSGKVKLYLKKHSEHF